MENRRENYRHEFGPNETLLVEVESCKEGKIYMGEIVSLSAGGVGIRIPRKEQALISKEQAMLRFTIPNDNVPFSTRAIMRHAKLEEKVWEYGFEFMRSENPAADAQRDKVIWRYLMELQRRQPKDSQAKKD